MEFTCKYDIDGFCEELDLSREDIAELFSELIKVYNSEIYELKKAAVEKDLNSINKIFHNLKGVSGNYRITDVYNETIAISQAIKTGSYDNLAKIIYDFSIIIERAVEEIVKYFHENKIELA